MEPLMTVHQCVTVMLMHVCVDSQSAELYLAWEKWQRI